MKAILKLVRANYDKLLHVTTSISIVLVLSKFSASTAFLLMAVFIIGWAWEALNWHMFKINPSLQDMLANMIGAIIGVLLI